MLSYLLYDLMQRKSLISTKFTLHLFIQAVNKRLPTVCMHGVKYLGLYVNSCCLVIHLYLTVCDPMNGSMPGFPVLHYLMEFAQTYFHWIGDAIQPSLPLPPPSPPALNLFLHQGLFQWAGSLHQVTEVWSIGASATASVLPMNIQGWFPSELAGLVLAVQGTLKSLLQHLPFLPKKRRKEYQVYFPEYGGSLWVGGGKELLLGGAVLHPAVVVALVPAGRALSPWGRTPILHPLHLWSFRSHGWFTHSQKQYFQISF